ncbi:MAG: 23S rRNA (adenine(2030)-N(6))-methyltransferase RlmJ [Hyphomicrobiales bacterium]
MNYRHAFHAGNFADVVKHIVLARCIEHLKAKSAPFRVIDTHAGIGLYDLSGEAAERTGEWRAGIGRLLAAEFSDRIKALIRPYLDTIQATRAAHGPHSYPGSPEVARFLTRSEDRLILIEKHPADRARLAENLAFDGRAKIIEIDAWVGLKAFIPPKERRGLVLIDPPFEEAGEFGRLSTSIFHAHRKWPTGIYALWYPLKDAGAVADFIGTIQTSRIPKMLSLEFRTKAPTRVPSLFGCGIVIINPPWRLSGELSEILPELSNLLALGDGAGWNCEWLTESVAETFKSGE